jgi:hypothetical protein
MLTDEDLGLPPSMHETGHHFSDMASKPLPTFSKTEYHGHECTLHHHQDPFNNNQIVYTRTAPRMEARTGTTYGVDETQLQQTIQEEMIDLKMFLKAERGPKGDVDTQIKTHYRDKYRKRHNAAQEQQPAPAPEEPEEAPAAAAAAPPQHRGVYSPRHKVDSTLSRTLQEQVGAEENVGWKNEIPDGWGSGYTYQYARDSVPSAARGVPLPATFGGRGGGGKKSQQMSVQEDAALTSYERRTGRPGAQSSSEWVTWHQLPKGHDSRDNDQGLARTGRIGVAPWQHCGGSSSSGKKGRNVAVDAQQSNRGGSVALSGARVGQCDRGRAPQGWFSPSHHSSGFHDPHRQQQNPTMFLKSENGRSHLGGGKLGRNHNKEYRGDSESWISSQARPQVGQFGTATGGGAKGRCHAKDAGQSSSSGRLIC